MNRISELTSISAQSNLNTDALHNVVSIYLHCARDFKCASKSPSAYYTMSGIWAVQSIIGIFLLNVQIIDSRLSETARRTADEHTGVLYYVLFFFSVLFLSVVYSNLTTTRIAHIRSTKRFCLYFWYYYSHLGRPYFRLANEK